MPLDNVFNIILKYSMVDITSCVSTILLLPSFVKKAGLLTSMVKLVRYRQVSRIVGDVS